MKKILLSLVALMMATTSFAESPEIDLRVIDQSRNVTRKDNQVKQESYFVKPGFKDGKLQSVEGGLSLDGDDSNALLVTNLDKYKVFGKTVETIATGSTNRSGKKVSAGLGVAVPLGEHFGISVKAIYYAEGVGLTERGRISNRFVPGVTFRVDANKLKSVFGL